MSKIDTWTTAPELEAKALSEESDHYVLDAYAATFEKDDVNDVIMPGAFKPWLERKAARGDALSLFYNHRWQEDLPLGPIVEVSEDRRGLKYKAHLPKDDVRISGQIVPQIRSKGLRKSSFGYKVRDSERRRTDGARMIKRLDVFEISLVGIPANRGADIIGIKGLVPFQDLPVDRKAASWDAEAALARIKARFGSEDEEFKRAFLHFDAEAGEGEDGNRIPDTRFLIADIDDSGRLVANQIALYKCASTVYGVRNGGLDLPEEAVDAVKGHLDRYYSRLDHGSPAQSLSEGEYKALSPAEREVRLRGLGISQRLAKSLVSGQRDADRSPAADFARLHEALFGLKDALSGIR
jgi:HK97 family phage prohead protease